MFSDAKQTAKRYGFVDDDRSTVRCRCLVATATPANLKYSKYFMHFVVKCMFAVRSEMSSRSAASMKCTANQSKQYASDSDMPRAYNVRHPFRRDFTNERQKKKKKQKCISRGQPTKCMFDAYMGQIERQLTNKLSTRNMRHKQNLNLNISVYFSDESVMSRSAEMSL